MQEKKVYYKQLNNQQNNEKTTNINSAINLPKFLFARKNKVRIYPIIDRHFLC